MIARGILYFGKQAIVCCDARCEKAWGSVTRPSVRLSDDDDDVVFLADDELGIAPADPGTYEGGQAKPRHPDQRLNKWCVRACERSMISRPSHLEEVIETPDWSRRLYNLPSSDPSIAPVDGNPQGEDAQRLSAQHASAVGAAEAPVLPPHPQEPSDDA